MGKKAEPAIANLQRELHRWYRRQRRDLPWRRNKDPYRIWVSEIMLQQTRVEAVIPYFERFLRRFPTLQDLARAPQAEVLREWAGLGYYRRARNLHKAAALVCEQYDGRLPQHPDHVQKLPGVGRYTAGAILSIAYDQPQPILDGNVTRVLCRLFRLPGDPRREPLVGELWRLAAQFADYSSPGDLNQALMELGAVVCLPGGSARCDSCPVHDRCLARAHGEVEELPQTAARTPLVAQNWAVLLVQRRGRTLLRPRRGNLLHGLWELPSVEAASASTRDMTSALENQLGSELGLDLEVHDPLFRHRQTISGRDVTFHVWSGQASGNTTRGGARWLWPRQIQQRAVITATQRILQKLSSSPPAHSRTAPRSSAKRPAKR